MKTYSITVTFIEPLLGTAPMNKEIYSEFIASKGEGNGDELETLDIPAEIQKGTTGFHRVDGKPILYDYMIKGFFKDACGMLRRDPASLSYRATAYKKIIDGLLFVKPPPLPLQVRGEVGILERPLRAQTAQGERIALSRSEMLMEGSSLTFTVSVISGVSDGLLKEWLDYGALRGLGQWRNGGYGAFTYTMAEA